MQRVPDIMNWSVKVNRIHSFPPFSFTVQYRLKGIIGHTLLLPLLITGVAHRHKLTPGAPRTIVKTDAETQTMLTGNLFPGTDNVLLGTNIDRIPRLVGRIP